MIKGGAPKAVVAMLVEQQCCWGRIGCWSGGFCRTGWRGGSYAPSAEVAEIEEALSLTGKGTRIWAAVNPALRGGGGV